MLVAPSGVVAVIAAVAVNDTAGDATNAVAIAACSVLPTAFMHGAHRRDDIHIRSAATDIAAHAFANLVVGELWRPAADIGGHDAGRAVTEFVQQGSRGTQ